MDLELFRVVADIDRSEALVVRRDSRIVKPQDLRNKRLAAPVGSTAHFHLLFALEQFGIPKDAVEIINMSPDEIGEVWKESRIERPFARFACTPIRRCANNPQGRGWVAGALAASHGRCRITRRFFETTGS